MIDPFEPSGPPPERGTEPDPWAATLQKISFRWTAPSSELGASPDALSPAAKEEHRLLVSEFIALFSSFPDHHAVYGSAKKILARTLGDDGLAYRWTAGAALAALATVVQEEVTMREVLHFQRGIEGGLFDGLAARQEVAYGAIDAIRKDRRLSGGQKRKELDRVILEAIEDGSDTIRKIHLEAARLIVRAAELPPRVTALLGEMEPAIPPDWTQRLEEQLAPHMRRRFEAEMLAKAGEFKALIEDSLQALRRVKR